MPKEERIVTEGMGTEVLPETMFRVECWDNGMCSPTISGNMRKRSIPELALRSDKIPHTDCTGYLPGVRASHGCIRMPYGKARQFDEASCIGTTVTVRP